MLASAALLTVSLNSCNVNENGGGVPRSLLVGKWEYSKERTSTSGQVLPEQDYTGNQPGCPKDYYKFNDDGTLEHGDYRNPECDLEVYTAIWYMIGSTLMINDMGLLTPLKIENISSNRLVFKKQYEESGVVWTERNTLLKVE